MNPEGSGPNVPGPERFLVLSRTGVTVVTDWCPLSDLVSWVIPPLRPSLCKRPAWSLLTMAKAVDKLQCSECMEFLALVRGAPLTRIACANCQQAKQDPPGKARSGHGPQLRSALKALGCGEVVVMPNAGLAVSEAFTCPDCGMAFPTKGALGSHRQMHETSWDKAIEKKERSV